VSLLNQAREKLESMIDTMHAPLIGVQSKPRTYRQTAREDCLSWPKKRSRGGKAWRKAVFKQLGYVKRNLNTIELIQTGGAGTLSQRQQQDLDTIQKLFC